MPVTLYWVGTQKDIILYKIEEDWTWKEFREVDQPVWELVNNADHRVDLLMDFYNIDHIPLGLPDVMRWVGENRRPDKEGLVIVIGGPMYFKVLLRVFIRLYPRLENIYHIVATFDKAIQLIEDHRNEPVGEELTLFE